ncbi:hypothetical protein SCLCIDRAFT_1215357 [Scleroderma citrinum Foug A]|uniref:Uncharacterized protein n=1 Tax=Scleroderma citrinum Foug A TaxID=1036808 RepID=A0A0C3E1Q1_9AGAM|nr:hypothetical protein SCLCIDRAFT_1215357 [Scleroderma citrinum Foug A]
MYKPRQQDMTNHRKENRRSRTKRGWNGAENWSDASHYPRLHNIPAKRIERSCHY